MLSFLASYDLAWRGELQFLAKSKAQVEGEHSLGSSIHTSKQPEVEGAISLVARSLGSFRLLQNMYSTRTPALSAAQHISFAAFPRLR